jgi:hypothetical protein
MSTKEKIPEAPTLTDSHVEERIGQTRCEDEDKERGEIH